MRAPDGHMRAPTGLPMHPESTPGYAVRHHMPPHARSSRGFRWTCRWPQWCECRRRMACGAITVQYIWLSFFVWALALARHTLVCVSCAAPHRHGTTTITTLQVLISDASGSGLGLNDPCCIWILCTGDWNELNISAAFSELDISLPRCTYVHALCCLPCQEHSSGREKQTPSAIHRPSSAPPPSPHPSSLLPIQPSPLPLS